LRRAAETFAQAISAHGVRQLGFILSSNTPECLAAYVGSLQAGHPIALFAADLSPAFLANLLLVYQPEWVYAPDVVPPLSGYSTTVMGEGHCLWRRPPATDALTSPELALLLSTSGSTGAPKLVRLSHGNVQANAQSISEYLTLDSRERPVTSLPFQYSYGLSVINSHLLVGATILLTDRSIVQREFWNFIRAERATSLAGVPYSYQMMLRAKLLDRDLPFSTLTQAGGRLDPQHIDSVQEIAGKRGWRFFVMYGQTEATARISFVPPDRLLEKSGSVGLPIPGGRLRVDEATDELIYEGPNVMLGYAENRADLAKGDELHGVLRTGDLGRRDQDGFFYITGRKKRFLKMFGQRVSLDDIERTVSARFDAPVACFGTDDHLRIAVEDEHAAGLIQHFVCDLYGFHHTSVQVSHLLQLPINTSGKVDYTALSHGTPLIVRPSADLQQ
jgi:acyl-CoA synthetase (AMP-forming)/AMP-acid ligase II